MSTHRTSFHDRAVTRLGRTGWLYLSSALPWIALLVLLRIAVQSDLLVRPTDAIPLIGALLRHGWIRRDRAAEG